MNLDELDNLVNQKISNAEQLRTDVMDRLEATKTAVKDALREEVERVVTDVKTLPEYKMLGAINEADFFEKAVKRNPGLLADIIGRNTINERMYFADDGFDSDLKKAYEKKNSKKTALKNRAKQVIDSYNEILNDVADKIAVMKNDVKEKENKINQLEADITKIAEAMQKAKPEAIAEMQKQIAIKRTEKLELETKRDTVKEKVEKFTEKQVEYKLKIEQEIAKFEDEFNDKAKVEVGSYERTSENAKTDNGTGNNMVSSGNKINGQLRTKDSNREIAKKMLLDLKGMETNDMKTLINQYGYEDLLEMTKNLGYSGRVQLQRVLETILPADKDFNQEKTIDRLVKFKANIKNKTPNEIEIFEKEIERINILSLYNYSKVGGLKRFFQNFTKKGAKINQLNQALKDYSNMKYDRETVALKTANALRKTMHVTERNDQRPRTFLNKKKISPVREDRSR